MTKVKLVAIPAVIQDIEANYSVEGNKTFFLLNKYRPDTHDQYPTMISTQIVGFAFGNIGLDELQAYCDNYNRKTNSSLSLLQFIKQEYGTIAERGTKCVG